MICIVNKFKVNTVEETIMSETYVVKSGDSLSKIASQFHVQGGYMTLAKYNNISNPNFICVGQKIKIPGSTTSASSSGQTNTTNTSSGGGSVGVGSKVKITGSNYATGQTIPNWVKQNTYTVSQISGAKALIKEIWSWVYTKDLKLVSGGTQTEPEKPQNQAKTDTSGQTQNNNNNQNQDSGGIESKPNTGASSLATSAVNFGSINSNPRQNKVSKITIHHMAGDMGATSCANMHKNGSASANYYVGSDGAICSGVAGSYITYSGAWSDTEHPCAAICGENLSDH